MKFDLKILRTLIAVVVVTLAATACDQPAGGKKFDAADITGAEFGKDFHLTDQNGKPRSLADFKGKVVAVFFGYTFCPDVCPITLAELSGALKQLGADAARVQVLFITVDPERDTQAVLARYVSFFNPDFLGLYGSAEQTKETAKEYNVFYEKEPGNTPGSYSVSHSAGTYLYDPAGRLRLFVMYGEGGKVFVHDIKLLLSE